MEKQRTKKDDGRYQIFYSFGVTSKQAEKETPSSTTSYKDHAPTSTAVKR